MNVSRRDFLKYCGMAAGALGLSALQLEKLEAAVLTGGAPSVVWLHGSGCQGDSVSLLNRIAPGEIASTVDDLLINTVNLSYHAILTTPAGRTATAGAFRALQDGNYVLVAEGGIPTAFEGNACTVWSENGREVTYEEAVLRFVTDAKAIVALGTCACFGGISMAPPNPGQVKGVQRLLADEGITGKTVINIAGCPAHPDWIVGTLAKLILGESVELDLNNRPLAFFGKNVHDECPRNADAPTHAGFATTYGQDLLCLEDVGCRGPDTFADCPSRKWNNGTNWCVDSNGMCIGCVEPEFPGEAIYEVGTLKNFRRSCWVREFLKERAQA